MDALRYRAEKTLEDVRSLAQRHCFQSAAKRLGELRIELEQRLDTEGRLVPIFVSRTGDQAGLALRLQKDHNDIRTQFDMVAAAITHWEISAVLRAVDDLAELLRAHHLREGDFRPALDDLLPEDGDWEALRHRLLNSSRPS